MQKGNLQKKEKMIDEPHRLDKSKESFRFEPISFRHLKLCVLAKNIFAKTKNHANISLSQRNKK
jgi:hypothetical protein